MAAYPAGIRDADYSARFSRGLRQRGQWCPESPLVHVYGEQPPAFLGTAHITADELIPQRLLSPVEIQDMVQAAQKSASSSMPVLVPGASAVTA